MAEETTSPLITPYFLANIEHRTNTPPNAAQGGVFSNSSYSRNNRNMSRPSQRSGRVTILLAGSYVLDWIILIGFAVVGTVLGNITPNKRPFSLEDRDISFPFTVNETVSTTTLVLVSAVAPIVIIAVIALVFIPGRTIPPGTPKSLVWRRKLWELHQGLLGLALSLIAAWFITNGMKNLFGKPRPDLLSRCDPDLANISKYVVGGLAVDDSNGQLVKADICQSTDTSTLDDGFRAFPSGHSSFSAAGLIYVSLFIASKFAIAIPFLAPSSYGNASSFTAFPSRMRHGGAAYELSDRNRDSEALSKPADQLTRQRLAQHNETVLSVHRQAAAPPLYLLGICVIPFFASVFIASSRWYDFRHHGFDILFGFFIGTVMAFFSFRYYHLPISQGAGWAWGPRSPDKAFWGGVGSYSYATDRVHYDAGDEEEAAAGPSVGGAQGSARDVHGDEASARRTNALQSQVEP